MLNLVLIADIQAHNYRRFATIDDTGRSSRFNVIKECLGAALEYAAKHDATLVILGDLLEDREKLDPRVLRDVMYLLSHNRVIIVAGNHDQISQNDKNMESSAGIFAPVVDAVFEEPGIYTFPGITKRATAIFLPYKKSAKALRADMARFAGLAEWEDADARFVFGHCGLAEEASLYNIGEECISIADIPADCNIAAFGHFHEPAEYDLPGGGKAIMVGAPIMHTFGDKNHERGWVHVTVQDDGQVSYQCVNYEGAPRFVTVSSKNEIGPHLAGHFVRVIAPDKKAAKAWRSLAEQEGATRVEAMAETKVKQNTQRVAIDLTMSASVGLNEYLKVVPPPAPLTVKEILAMNAKL